MGAMKQMFEDAQFKGSTYEPSRDRARLTGQLGRVYDFMSAGGWWSLSLITKACGGSEAGVSARLRQLRNEYGYIIERRRVDGGLYEYRMQS